MRKLKLQVQISVDGYIAGPNGEMDWMTWNWDDELKNCVSELTAPVDTIVLGRILAEGFIGYWAGVAANPDDPSQPFGKIMTGTPKVVFTKTLEKSGWDNTILAKGDLAEEINKLKSLEGGDIIAYGGASFVSGLIKAGLIDEYNLFVNPAVVGNGMPIFKEISSRLNLELIKAQAFSCGVALLRYSPVQPSL